MKQWLLVGLCVLAIGCSSGSGGNGGGNQQPPQSGPTASEQLAADIQGLPLEAFYDVSIEALVRRSPEGIIWRSLQDVYPLATADLDNMSDDYQRETFAMYEVALDALRTYDRSMLDADGQLNYDVYEWYLQDVVDRRPFMYHNFVATYNIISVQRQTQQMFTEVHPLETLQDAEDYIERLSKVDEKFAQVADHLLLQRDAGIVEPAITMQVAINILNSSLQQSSDSSPYFSALAERIDGIPGIDQATRDTLLNRARGEVGSSVRRGLQTLLDTLQTLLSQAPASIGVGQYPNGADYYAYALRHHTTSDLTPAEIHQLGLDELERIHAEMRVIFDQLGYPGEESLEQLFARVATDGGMISGPDVKSTYEGIIDLARANASVAFDIFPSSDVVVIADPGGGGYYIGPSSDGTRPGAFYAGTGQQPWAPMRSLAYHEAIPGHHTQIAIAVDQDLPMIRKIPRSTGFIEGWGLYAERLAWELGWHEDDPYSNLGRLQFEALRAARLVMDTGIHSLGWSFGRATLFNQQNVGASVGASQGAAGRYSVWPGQATAYMVGMLQILDERQRAMDELGEQFDLRGFHRALLANGSIPLTLLDDVVDRYIAETLANP